jgi:hypothetical protein
MSIIKRVLEAEETSRVVTALLNRRQPVAVIPVARERFAVSTTDANLELLERSRGTTAKGE